MGTIYRIVQAPPEKAVVSFYGGNLEFFEYTGPEAIVSSGAEAGKSFAACWKLHLLASNYPGAQLAIVRKIYRTTYTSVLQTYDRVLAYTPGVAHRFGGEHPEFYDYNNGSRVWIAGMDNPDKVLSSERDVIYVNQAEELSLADWETLTTRATGRGAVMPYTQVIGDCNPSHPLHWIVTRSRAGHLKLFTSTLRDNPTLYDHQKGEWTAQGRRSRATLQRLTGSRRSRLYLGLWSAAEGVVYESFDAARHVVPAFRPPTMWPRFAGVDPAGAYVAGTWLAWDEQNQQLHAYREYLGSFGQSIAWHAGQMVDKGETVLVWCGGAPSEGQLRIEWQHAGVPLVQPPVGDRETGISRVNELLQEEPPALIIHDNCVGLLSEIGDMKRHIVDGVVTDKVENEERYHLLSSLRYIIVWLTESVDGMVRQVFDPPSRRRY